MFKINFDYHYRLIFFIRHLFIIIIIIIIIILFHSFFFLAVTLAINNYLNRLLFLHFIGTDVLQQIWNVLIELWNVYNLCVLVTELIRNRNFCKQLFIIA